MQPTRRPAPPVRRLTTSGTGSATLSGAASPGRTSPEVPAAAGFGGSGGPSRTVSSDVQAPIHEDEDDSMFGPEVNELDEYKKESEKEEKRVRMRRLAVQEVITTERDYVADLMLIKRVYLDKIAKACPSLTREDINHLFSNTEVILSVNKAFVQDIEKRNLESKEIERIGDLFVSMAPYLKMYTEYCANQPIALSTLEKLEKENAEFAAFLQDTLSNPECRGLNLFSYIIKPIQRICKYPLLLREVIRFTPEDHADFADLQTAMGAITAVVDFVNERKRQAEAQEKLMWITNNTTNLGFTLVSPTRKFIEEIDLSVIRGSIKDKLKKAEPQPNRVILFSDMVLAVKVKSNGKYSQPLRFVFGDMSATLINIHDEDAPAFQLEDKNEGNFVTIKFPSEELKDTWFKHIRNIVREEQKKMALNSKRGTLGGSNQLQRSLSNMNSFGTSSMSQPTSPGLSRPSASDVFSGDESDSLSTSGELSTTASPSPILPDDSEPPAQTPSSAPPRKAPPPRPVRAASAYIENATAEMEAKQPQSPSPLSPNWNSGGSSVSVDSLLTRSQSPHSRVVAANAQRPVSTPNNPALHATNASSSTTNTPSNMNTNTNTNPNPNTNPTSPPTRPGRPGPATPPRGPAAAATPVAAATPSPAPLSAGQAARALGPAPGSPHARRPSNPSARPVSSATTPSPLESSQVPASASSTPNQNQNQFPPTPNRVGGAGVGPGTPAVARRAGASPTAASPAPGNASPHRRPPGPGQAQSPAAAAGAAAAPNSPQPLQTRPTRPAAPSGLAATSAANQQQATARTSTPPPGRLARR